MEWKTVKASQKKKKKCVALPNSAILNTQGNSFEILKICEYVILI